MVFLQYNLTTCINLALKLYRLSVYILYIIILLNVYQKKADVSIPMSANA